MISRRQLLARAVLGVAALYGLRGTAVEAPVFARSDVPIGTVIETTTGSKILTDHGYLLCDGSAVSRTAYPDLYEVVGETFGGRGRRFRVPDLRGRVVA